MKKIIMIIIAILNYYISYSQDVEYKRDHSEQKIGTTYFYYTSPMTYCLTPENQNSNIEKAQDCIDWYNEKSNEKLEYDSLVFDYPFYIYAFNGDELVAKLSMVQCQKIGVESKLILLSKSKVPAHVMRIKLSNGQVSSLYRDLFTDSFFIEPSKTDMKPFFSGVLMSDEIYEPFIRNMLYHIKGVEQLLAKSSNSKSLR